MLKQNKVVWSCLAASWLGVVSPSSHALVEDFSANPFPTWSFGIGDNSNNQFIWNSSAPAVYSGDAVGSLGAHLDSSLSTARLQRPLGVTVTDTDNFTLATRFSFAVTSAPGDQFMQMAFGLVNSALTGGDRTGSFSNFGSDDVFHTVEFNYYPNVTFFGGPVLSPAVFGAQKGGGDAFGNFASIFGPDSDLGDNTVGITALPQSATLEAVLDYNGATKVLTLTMNQVNANGSLTLLNTELPALDLDTTFYDGAFPFVVDTLAIMAYNDGFTSTGNPSLVADLTFERFEFTSAAIPEPSAVALFVAGVVLLKLRVGGASARRPVGS